MSQNGKETNSSTCRAGQIKNHVKQWKEVSTDSWLISTIQGVEIPFLEEPVQVSEPHPYKLSKEECTFVNKELGRMLDKGIVEKTEPSHGQVISNIFLRPKKDGSYRMILDLTWLNEHVQYEHFKMHSIQTALDMMRPNCWMGSVDLKDAYYSVPICETQLRFLRFKWGNSYYQFTVLPNGLACAPRFFTKILNPVFAVLREKGHECFQYIDDSFVVADSVESCRESLEILSEMLEGLGFGLHPEKSVVTPVQRLVFLGFELDSVKFKVFLTEDKEQKLLRAAGDVLEKVFPSIREVAGLIGLTISYAKAFKFGARHTKQLEIEKVVALARTRGNFDGKMSLSEKARWDIHWWIDHVQDSGRRILDGKLTKTLYTDASNEGWGAHVGHLATGGRWSQEEKGDHINVLELRAIEFGLKSLCEETSAHVRVFTDNMTALAYVNHQGGVKSPDCNEAAQKIWAWCEERDIWLSVAHIPGILNERADYESRNFADNIEWSLKESLFKRIVGVLGQPEIDLFATRLNNKVERYISWKPDPNAVAVDAFTYNWTNEFFYAFPPFSCVGRAVQKILDEKASGILVVPWWPGQPWWGQLIKQGLRRLQFRRRNGNLVPQGSPENAGFLHRSPLGAFRF